MLQELPEFLPEKSSETADSIRPELSEAAMTLAGAERPQPDSSVRDIPGHERHHDTDIETASRRPRRCLRTAHSRIGRWRYRAPSRHDGRRMRVSSRESVSKNGRGLAYRSAGDGKDLRPRLTLIPLTRPEAGWRWLAQFLRATVWLRDTPLNAIVRGCRPSLETRT